MTDRPDSPSGSPPSSSSPPLLDHASERLLGDIARGIKGNTDGLFALKTILEKLVGEALVTLRRDRLDSDDRQVKRLTELNATISGINLGNERALGAMQELIDNYAATSSLERGLLTGAREGVDKAVAGIEKTRRDITEQNIKLALPARGEVEIDVQGAAPVSVRIFAGRLAVHAVNILWPITVRMAPTVLGRIFQALGGGAVLAALGRLIHFYVTHAP
jgi:hypothetical protein